MNWAGLPPAMVTRLAQLAPQLDRNPDWAVLQVLAEWTVCLWLCTPPPTRRAATLGWCAAKWCRTRVTRGVGPQFCPKHGGQ